MLEAYKQDQNNHIQIRDIFLFRSSA